MSDSVGVSCVTHHHLSAFCAYSFSEVVKEQAVEKKEEKKVAKAATQQKKNDKVK